MIKHIKKDSYTYCSKNLNFTLMCLYCLHGDAWTENPVFSKLYIGIEPSAGDGAAGDVPGDCCVAGGGRGGAEREVLSTELNLKCHS